MYYSKSTGGFYHDPMIMPSDGIEISDELYKFLLEEQSNGKQIVSGKDGKPIAVNRAVQETDDSARRRRDARPAE